MTTVVALIAGVVGMVCLVVGVRRRKDPDTPWDEKVLILVGGFALVLAATATLS